MSLRNLIAIAAALIFWLPNASAQQATDASKHFAGKTIKVVVPTGPGGAYGLPDYPYASAMIWPKESRKV
jgi:hypothetical protein